MPLIAFAAALLVALGPGLSWTIAEAKAPRDRYRTKPGVRLSAEVEAKVADLAQRYFAKTKRTLLITSGTRSAQEQAAAMYGKLRAGDRLGMYRNQAAIAPLRAIYDRGRKKRAKRAAVVAEMAEVIAEQCARGVYISRHLRAHAFDVRSFDMSSRQKRAFLRAVEEVGGLSVIEERRPPHFHLELR